MIVRENRSLIHLSILGNVQAFFIGLILLLNCEASYNEIFAVHTCPTSVENAIFERIVTRKRVGNWEVKFKNAKVRARFCLSYNATKISFE